jgi:hypothetical protein
MEQSRGSTAHSSLINDFLYHRRAPQVATRVCRSPFAAAGSVKSPRASVKRAKLRSRFGR